MRVFVILSLVFAVGLSGSNAFSKDAEEAGNGETLFKSGVEAFQKKDFAKARAQFSAAMTKEGETPFLLFNLGLVENRLGQNGLALGLWRKALVNNPTHSGAKNAAAWVQTKLEKAEIPHEVETWESFRTLVLIHAGLTHFLLATALLLLAFGLLVLRNLGKRRSARLDEKPLPGFPVLTLLAGVLFFISAGLSLAKALDSQTLRGTILPKKIEARSSPDANATSLFELYEGLEVIVRRTDKVGEAEWAQVTYPGAATGWIPKAAVFATTDSAQSLRTE